MLPEHSNFLGGNVAILTQNDFIEILARRIQHDKFDSKKIFYANIKQSRFKLLPLGFQVHLGWYQLTITIENDTIKAVVFLPEPDGFEPEEFIFSDQCDARGLFWSIINLATTPKNPTQS